MTTLNRQKVLEAVKKLLEETEIEDLSSDQLHRIFTLLKIYVLLNDIEEQEHAWLR